MTDDETPTLSLTANLASVSEDAGSAAVTYTVTRNTTDLTLPLTVNLTSGTPGRLTVGSTVTILAGQASVTFNGAAIGNSVIDGNAAVVVTAAATGFTSGTATVTVTDNDAGTLTVTPNIPSITEGAAAGTLTYTVSRTAANVSQPLTINLVSNTPSRLTVVGTVTILANATSATFDGTVVNNSVVDGNVSVIVTASASGFASGTGSVTVNDNDASVLALTPTTTTISENYAWHILLYSVSQHFRSNAASHRESDFGQH